MILSLGDFGRLCVSGNQHIPYQGTVENYFPFSGVGHVSSLEHRIYVIFGFLGSLTVDG